MFLGFCALVPILLLLVCSRMFRGAWTRADDVVVAHPEAAVPDARALIDDRREHPEKYEAWLAAEALPPSLRIAKLRYAIVHADHVDLVIARNPDWNVGARIWALDHRVHRDTPTRYREIWFFRHDNDAPESLSNIP